MTAKIALPNLEDDFNDSPISGANAALTLIVKQISAAVKIPMAMPKGKRREAFERYLALFTENKLSLFMVKLSTSIYVKNPKFSIDFMVRNDLVNTILTGSIEASKVSKYYNVKIMNV